MLWRRLPIPSPPYLRAPQPKTLLADFSREFSEGFLSGAAGWCRRHDLQGRMRRAWRMNLLVQPQRHPLLSCSASHLANLSFYLHTGQSELLHFYSPAPFLIDSNPILTQDIKHSPLLQYSYQNSSKGGFLNTSNHS